MRSDDVLVSESVFDHPGHIVSLKLNPENKLKETKLTWQIKTARYDIFTLGDISNCEKDDIFR